MTPAAETLIALAGQATYERGARYFRTGAVHRLRWQEQQLMATVVGRERYQVTLTLAPELAGLCSCPAWAHRHFCKHCVAVALAYAASTAADAPLFPTAAPEPIRRHLEHLDKSALIDCLLELIEADPVLESRWRMKALAAAGQVDAQALRLLIDEALLAEPMWEYAEVKRYFAEAETRLEPLWDTLEQLDSEPGFSLLNHAFERLNEVLQQCDDSHGHRFGLEGMLKTALVRAFRHLPWSVERKVDYLLEQLDHPRDVFPDVPGDFFPAPELETAFHAHCEAELTAMVTDPGRVPEEQRSRYQRLLWPLLRRARAQGDMVRQIALTKPLAEGYHDFLQLCELHIQLEEPLDAEYWLQKARREARAGQDEQCLTLAIKIHLLQAEYQSALDAQWSLFTRQPRLTHYQTLLELATLAGQSADVQRQAAERLLRDVAVAEQSRLRSGFVTTTPLLDFYLYHDEEQKAVDWASHNKVAIAQLKALADRIIGRQPEQATLFYRRILLALIGEGNNGAYQQAVDMLRALRQPLSHNGEQLFADLLQTIRQEGKRKRNLIKLLDQHF